MSSFERSDQVYERSPYSYERSDQTVTRSPRVVRDSELRSAQEQQSINRQRISRAERSALRNLRNMEREALANANSTRRRREIKKAADDERARIEKKALEARGKYEEGVLYDSVQYENPTDNGQSTTSSATNNSGIDSISGEEAPGDSQGGASGGLPNDNSTTDDGDTFVLDIVKSNNTAGTATFKGKIN